MDRVHADEPMATEKEEDVNMKAVKNNNHIEITMDAETTAKTFSSGKEGWYERQDVKIGDKVYTVQVQIYEKK